MIEQMLAWDKEVILWIHRNLHSNIGDIIIPWLRKPTFWIPLYILIIYIFIKWWKARGLIVVAMDTASAICIPENKSLLYR